MSLSVRSLAFPDPNERRDRDIAMSLTLRTIFLCCDAMRERRQETTQRRSTVELDGGLGERNRD
jgi:hypothetical protein